MKILISWLLLVILNTVVCFPAIDNGMILVDRADQVQVHRPRTLNINAFDLLGLFGRRGGFLRPIIQNTLGNGNTMTLQTGITLLNSLFNGYGETGGGNGGGLLGLNLV